MAQIDRGPRRRRGCGRARWRCFPRIAAKGCCRTPRSCGCKLSQLRLCRPRQWGACWLALKLWEELRLDRFWGERLPASRKGTRWDQVLFVLVAYRLIAPGSEWRLHREWFERSALADSARRGRGAGGDSHALSLSRPAARAQAGGVRSSGGALARSVQRLLRRAALRPDQHLFRGRSAVPRRRQAPLRLLARSSGRDCVQVVIALVVTPEGLPLAYEVLRRQHRGQHHARAAFLRRIERQYGKARRIWVMDRGIPTEAVLAEMRAADPPVHYLVGTPKGRLSRLEQALLAKPWQEARPGVQVKLLPQDGELYVFAAEPRPRRQGARHAPAPAQVAVGAAQATRGDEAHARGAADEARRRARQGADGLAPRRRRGGARSSATLQLSARPRQAAAGAPARGPLSAAHQSHRGRIPPSSGTTTCSSWRWRRPSRTSRATSPSGRSSTSAKRASRRTSSSPSSPIACTSPSSAGSHALAPGLTPRSVLEKFAAVQMIDVHVPTTDGRELHAHPLHPARARAHAPARQTQARTSRPAAAQNHRRPGDLGAAPV